MLSRFLLLSSILVSLSACGSVVNGNSQVIYVNALPNNNKATSCTLENERGSWNAPFLPSSVSVSRSNGPLTVTCNSVDGYHGSVSVKSDVSSSAVIGGGLVYPDSVVVPMYPTRTSAPNEAQGFPYRANSSPHRTPQASPVYHHRAVPAPAPVVPSRGNS